jgi:1-acyl-sn-glycerol-3-phosphate acyltransferase
MRLRAFRRAVALVIALALCVFHYWSIRIHGPLSMVRRALWLQSAARRILGALGIKSEVRGTPPSQGLVVANHLSYLDIVILSSAMPCFFVAKAEIDRWPFFGKAARTGGTIFIDRNSRASTARVAKEIAERLPLPVPVLLFPEGTSTDGSKVLRFHSSLFDPATRAGALVTASSVRYVLHDGKAERDLCWYDDSLFLSHIWKALGTSGFSAEVVFGESRVYSNRRVAADVTHDEIVAMRAALETAQPVISSQAAGNVVTLTVP